MNPSCTCKVRDRGSPPQPPGLTALDRAHSAARSVIFFSSLWTARERAARHLLQLTVDRTGARCAFIP